MTKTRVVIVDDSDIAAELVQRVIEAAPDMVVVGRARTADELIASGMHEGADVVLLDLWMPGRTGLGVIKELAEERPVIVVSDVGPESPLAREATAQGARAFFSKSELSSKAGTVRVRSIVRAAAKRGAGVGLGPIVAIVGSTGAMEPLESLLRGTTPGPAAFIVLQHMPVGREAGFARFIRSLGHDARVAATGDVLEPSRVYIAPADGHLVVRDGGRINIKKDEPVEGHRPSGSVLLESLTPLGARVIAIILSGMGRDGARAIPQLAERGATVLVQAPDECAVASMPRAALEGSKRVRAVKVAQLGATVTYLVERAVRV